MYKNKNDKYLMIEEVVVSVFCDPKPTPHTSVWMLDKARGGNMHPRHLKRL
jgi:hypothetical protein